MAPLRSIWCCTLEEDVDGIKELICDGVPVDSRNSVGETCLHLAARHGLEVVVKVSQVNHESLTSLRTAHSCDVVLALRSCS